MRIDTLIFDFGGVLYFPPQGQGLHRWLKFLGLRDDEKIMDMIDDPLNSTLFWEIMRGTVNENEFWQYLVKKWHIPKPIFYLFQNKLKAKRNLNNYMLSFIQKKCSLYKTAILSNAGNNTRSLMENSFKLDTLVDKIIISAEEGFAKPDKELFHIALSKLNSIPKQCIFIDDLERNIAAAKEIGIRSVLFSDSQQTIDAIEKILLEEN